MERSKAEHEETENVAVVLKSGCMNNVFTLMRVWRDR